MRDGLVAERFPWAAPREHPLNHHVKSLVRADRVDYMLIHAAKLSSGVYVDAGGRPVAIHDAGLIYSVDYDHAQINHYCVKSLSEFAEKKRRGTATSGLADPNKYSSRDIHDWFERHDRNEEEDLSLLRSRNRVCEGIEQLKGALGGR